jgi:hypothetical protein
VKTFVQSLQDAGGTELLPAIQRAVQDFGNEKIIFLFTDGDVGNESQIAGYVRQNIGKSSLFIFGIDSSVNKEGLNEIAEAGRGKAEFIVKDEMIKEMIIRQFARATSTNLFNIALNQKTNKVINKIEKSQVIFNHEFYDVLIEVNNVIDDFELTCKTDNKIYSFVIPQNALEHSDLPLDKIYASEQIRLAEKYINRQWDEENKGYKERIVEIAVKYQIDSKYTAFIAVNERDEKLTDIPELQDTILESPEGWDMMADNLMAEKMCFSFTAVPQLSFPRQMLSFVSNFSPMKTSIADNIDTLFEKIKECEELIDQNVDYQAFLDEIIDELQPHFSFPSRGYKKLFKKMKKETPKVYALIEPYLKQK